MSKTNDLVEERVDAFVAAVNASPCGILFDNEVPPEGIAATSENHVQWRIVVSRGAPWLPEFEGLVRFRLPRTFRSLIARYLFPALEAGPLALDSIGARNPESTG